MELSSIISIKGDAKALLDAMRPGLEKSTERVEVKHELHGNELVFKIKAKDPTALKAACTSVINLITVYQKVKDIGERD